jgi:hypothetical protein
LPRPGWLIEGTIPFQAVATVASGLPAGIDNATTFFAATIAVSFAGATIRSVVTTTASATTASIRSVPLTAASSTSATVLLDALFAVNGARCLRRHCRRCTTGPSVIATSAASVASASVFLDAAFAVNSAYGLSCRCCRCSLAPPVYTAAASVASAIVLFDVAFATDSAYRWRRRHRRFVQARRNHCSRLRSCLIWLSLNAQWLSPCCHCSISASSIICCWRQWLPKVIKL